MLDNDFLHDRQPEAGSIGLGGVKGHENLGQRFGWNAGPIIGNENPLSLEWAGYVNLAANDHAPAGGIVGSGFRGVARQIENRLAQKSVIAGDFAELSNCGEWNTRYGLANFRHDPLDHWAERNLFVGEFQGTRKLEEFRDHVGQGPRLPEDKIAVLVQIGAGLRLAPDHLGVTGNRRQGILKFVRDARGKLAERGQIFLHVNLFLQGGEFGQIAQQANRAGDFIRVVLDWGNGHAELPQFVRGSQV